MVIFPLAVSDLEASEDWLWLQQSIYIWILVLVQTKEGPRPLGPLPDKCFPFPDQLTSKAALQM